MSAGASLAERPGNRKGPALIQPVWVISRQFGLLFELWAKRF